MKIPKIIWIFWNTGFETAHPVVINCVKSWKRNNPDWEIRQLDKDSLDQYIDNIDVPFEIFESLPIQKKANLIRLKLLAEYGGVWADATCFCMKPLDSWLPEHAPTGVFMFSDPGRDRIISNWFIASSPGNHLTVQLYNRRCSFWSKYQFNHKGYRMKKLMPYFSRVINRNRHRPLWWFNPFFTRVLKITPYLIFHYDFYRMLREEPECKEIWDEVKKISAVEAHRIQRLGMLEPLSEEFKTYLQQTDIPLFKLNYKFDRQKLVEGTLLSYLFELNSDYEAISAHRN